MTSGAIGLTVDDVLAGTVSAADVRITAAALRVQADVARAGGREPLARNFERAAEMVAIPQEVLLATYDLLRPGRAASAEVLRARADALRREHGAELCAAMLEEAAVIYTKRGLFVRRT